MIPIIHHIILALILLCITQAQSIKIGRQIPVSGRGATELNTKIKGIREELDSYRISHQDDSNGFIRRRHEFLGSYQKDVDKIINNLRQEMNKYLQLNSCLRYYFQDFVDFSELESSEGSAAHILLAINMIVENEPNPRVQSLNLNIMDKDMNALRRKNGIHERESHIAVDYPVMSKSREEYGNEHIDFCFENLKVDRSWSSDPHDINIYTDISFGLPAIKSNYMESTNRIGKINEKLEKSDTELDAMVNQMQSSMATAYSRLRDMNEDTYSKQTIFYILILCSYFGTCIFEILWLRRVLRLRKLA